MAVPRFSDIQQTVRNYVYFFLDFVLKNGIFRTAPGTDDVALTTVFIDFLVTFLSLSFKHLRVSVSTITQTFQTTLIYLLHIIYVSCKENPKDYITNIILP